MQQERITLPVGVTIRDAARDHYVIEALLGKGGFGAVYLVRDRRTRQNVFALKEVIDPDQHDRDRFVFEGEILKRLKHRALPHVYHVFEHAKLKRVYMLMDYIRGRDLEVIRNEQPEKRFSLPLVLAIMAPIVDALIYLHSQHAPIVHRDIKPANIIVPTRGDKAVLVDFGLAKEYVVDGTTTIFRHGSPGYAAPEQYGGGTNPRTDIYGLGATLYTLLTGLIPTQAITRATASRGLDPLEPANLVRPDIPWVVATAIERAMRISSEDRFETVEEFWQELNSHATQQQLHLSGTTSLGTSRLLTLPEQDIADIRTASLQNQQHAPRSRKPGTLLLILLALLIVFVVGTGSLSSIVSHSALHRVSSPLATATHTSVVASAGSPAADPTAESTPTPPGSSIYPSMAVSYTGTISDLLAQTKTTMFLTNIHQSQGTIRGSFLGLGLVGPFNGTLTTAGHLLFTVTVYAGKTTLAFEGAIKLGGDMAGSYEVLDQSGQPTGETGLWSLAPSL